MIKLPQDCFQIKARMNWRLKSVQQRCMFHSVEISGVFYLSDLSNQFWSFISHKNSQFYQLPNQHFCERLTFTSEKFPKIRFWSLQNRYNGSTYLIWNQPNWFHVKIKVAGKVAKCPQVRSTQCGKMRNSLSPKKYFVKSTI